MPVGGARKTIPEEKKGSRTLLIVGLLGVLLVFLVSSAIGAYLLFFSSGGAPEVAATMPRDSEMLFQISNRGQPMITVVDGNYQNRGELLLQHRHQGLDLDVKWSRETMRSLSDIWRRPVNVETEVDGQRKLFTYSGGEFTEKFL